MLAWAVGLILVAGGEFSAQQSNPIQADPLQKRTDTVANRVLYIDRILIVGNKVTRQRIIERELSLKPGDTIRSSLLQYTLQWDKNKLYNLRLFNTVVVRALELPNDHIDILIELTERWYIFPVPIFELSDRNFNEWWNNYDHDLSRINYGIRIYKNNFRGRNESLRLTAQFGFYRRFEFQYRIPNLDRKQKQGLTFNFDLGAPRNLAYQTKDHKLVFIQEDKVVRESFNAGIAYSYRKTYFETHSIGLNYRQSQVIDAVLDSNQIYYSGGKNTQRFTSLSYTFVSEHRDVILYPLKGYQFSGFIAHNGIFPTDDVNQTEISATYAVHHPLGNEFYISNFTAAFWSTPKNQPYTMFDALGYRSLIVRGFENYVVEGPTFAINKFTFKKRIFHKSWTMSHMPIEQFNYFPLAIYIKTFFDIGYVENYPYYSENKMNQIFSNKILTGTGAGLDFVTMYDLVMRIEYTWTQDGRGGLYLNLKKEF